MVGPAAFSAQTLIAAPLRLDTSRLVLCSPQVAHAPAMMALVNRSLPVLTHIAWAQQPWSLVRAEQFCRASRSAVARGEDLVFMVFERSTGALVGRIDLHSFEFQTPRAEIGYVSDVTFAGRGLMREAVLATMALGFSLGLARIEALSETTNHRALHFAERALGMRREGVLHHHERNAQGELGDQVLFAAYAP